MADERARQQDRQVARLAKLRRPGVVLLTVLGCLLAVLSLLTVWGRNQILDTDRYLASVLPMARDPVIQEEVAAKVAAAISSRLDAGDLVAGVLPKKARFLAGSIGGTVDTFIEDKSLALTHSETFVTLWTDLNRAGHVELVRMLRGEEPEAVVVAGGRLTLDLAPIVDAVRKRLVQAGLAVVATLPPISLVVDVADASGLQKAQTLVRRLDVVVTVLPIVAVGLLLGATALARRRWAAGAAVAVAVTWSMVLARALIAAGAHLAEIHVPERVATGPAVRAYYGHVTTLLHRGAVLTGVVFALLAVGLSLAPVTLRLARDAVADDAVADRSAVRLLAVAVGGCVLLVWPSPGVGTVVLVLVGTLGVTVLARRWAMPDGDVGSDALTAR